MFEKSLADIYDSQASKFSSTRRKHRPEMEYIVGTIVKQSLNNSGTIDVLEVGCGDGRLVEAISEKLEAKSFHYTGVDISQGLLTIAQDQNPTRTFVQSDMISYLQSLKQGSIDIIVGIASVQHLFPKKTREEFFAQAKRILKPGGILMLTNRARSDWAKEKYARGREFHLRQRIQTGAKRTSGDQMIPRIDPDTRETHQRYYHFFSLPELQSHLDSEREIRTLDYIDRDGSLTSSVRLARNSLVIASKT